jgi:predicted nucleic acid-binding protein
MADTGRADLGPLLCDTNVLVRFLTADSPTLSPIARRVIDAAISGRIAIVLTDVVIAELAYVLTSVYELDRHDVAAKVASLLRLPGVESSDPGLFEDALDVWSDGRLDFADAYLAAIARNFEGAGILSFDQDFDRIERVERVDPKTY